MAYTRTPGSSGSIRDPPPPVRPPPPVELLARRLPLPPLPPLLVSERLCEMIPAPASPKPTRNSAENMMMMMMIPDTVNKKSD